MPPFLPGGISAILVNTPGTPASITQSFDGYSLYRQGKGGLALGINVIYSSSVASSPPSA